MYYQERQQVLHRSSRGRLYDRAGVQQCLHAADRTSSLGVGHVPKLLGPEEPLEGRACQVLGAWGHEGSLRRHQLIVNNLAALSSFSANSTDADFRTALKLSI